MDDEDYLAHLEADLVSRGGRVAVSTTGKVTELTITRYEGIDLEHPTTIRTTNKAFVAYLTSMAKSGMAIWPEGPPIEAAYSLFEIHLDEEMTVLAGNPDTIDITAKAMKPYRSRPRVEEPLPPGEYEWRA